MSKISYKKSFLDLVKDFTSINTQIIISKNDKGNIVINRGNPAGSIVYYLEVPKENMEFDGDKIAFYDFPSFYQLLSVFINPELNLNDNKLTISEKKSKINFVLSDAETLKEDPGKFKFPEADATLKLDVAELKYLRKTVGLLDAKYIKFTGSGKNLTITIFNDSHDNSFEKSYELDKDVTKDFSFKIASEVVTLVPDNEYLVSVTHMGGVKFTYVKDGIDLSLLVAEVED